MTTEDHLPTRPMAAIAGAMAPLLHFLNDSSYAKVRFQPGLLDFTFGNPQEMPLPGLVAALKKHAEPQNPQWFAYKMSERTSQAAVAEALREWRGMPFESEDVIMTSGAFGAISVALRALLEVDDEVIFSLPPWFTYEAMVLAMGGQPVKVPLQAEDFDLDLDAIEAAISERTRMIIVNTPHNPTGRIYPEETLERLAAILTSASERNGRTIYLLSDEPYSRLVFDGKPFISPLAFYRHSLMSYSYGKVLLTPGQRVGYLALSPGMAERDAIRDSVTLAQLTNGWAFPNALLQHAIADLEELSVNLDIVPLQIKRDRFLVGLRDAGYEVHTPESTFYLVPKSPIADDWAFTEQLAAAGVYVMPGGVCELPGYLRICFTASEEMIEQALPIFAQVRADAG